MDQLAKEHARLVVVHDEGGRAGGCRVALLVRKVHERVGVGAAALGEDYRAGRPLRGGALHVGLCGVARKHDAPLDRPLRLGRADHRDGAVRRAA